ncbi:hypothetical protein T261_1779 [Streptomyces lydicus]|nr:hypothetical protein T261_1779 [Streptomyces lydicus]
MPRSDRARRSTVQLIVGATRPPPMINGHGIATVGDMLLRCLLLDRYLRV